MISFENISFLVFIPIAVVLLFFLIRHTFVQGSKKKRLRIYVFITRFIMISVLILALAAPYTVTKKVENRRSSVSVLVDKSKSMDLFDDQSDLLVKNIQDMTGLDVNVIRIGSDLSSPIGNALLNNMIGDDNILLVSDGNSNKGKDLKDVMFFASNINSTVNIVRLNLRKNDASVSITGSKYVLSGLSNTYYVNVDSVGSLNYDVIVKLDGRDIKKFSGSSSQSKPVELALTQGSHKLEAILKSNDENKINNHFYKSITVLDRPRVLFVSQKNSPIKKIFSKIYSLDTKTNIPSNLDSYFGVIIDDLPSSILEPHVQKLTNYVLDGNGLVVIGGQRSYDLGDYQKSQFQTLLPVKVGIGDIKNITSMNIVLIIDISVSSGIGVEGGSAINVEKAQALNILDKLKPEDYVGIIAFNKEAHVISELKPLSQQPDSAVKISRLQNNGGTYLETALIEAQKMLKDASGNKNIVIISDGKTKNPENVKERVIELKQKGVTTYTVGVGPATDEAYVDNLAMIGGGTYFRVGSVDRLSMVFGNERDVKKTEWNLLVFNQNHFITKNVVLNGKIYGYNQVVPKSTSQMLVSTDSGNPIITSWRFGLGRVISITTDGGLSWANDLLKQGNSVVVSRSSNWAVGDPRRKETLRLNIGDGRLGEDLEFKMYSEKVPVLDNVDLIQTDVNLYSGTIKPDKTGFFKIENEEFAVNYPKEYEQLGMNPELESIVKITHGSILDVNSPDEIANKIKKDNTREVENRNYYRYLYLPIIILVYIIEIYLRRKVKD